MLYPPGVRGRGAGDGAGGGMSSGDVFETGVSRGASGVVGDALAAPAGVANGDAVPIVCVIAPSSSGGCGVRVTCARFTIGIATGDEDRFAPNGSVFPAVGATAPIVPDGDRGGSGGGFRSTASGGAPEGAGGGELGLGPVM